MMNFIYNDGGRVKAGFKGEADDCVCRAIAIATQKPYKEIYNLIVDFGKKERITKNNKTRSHPRTGVNKKTTRKIMEYLGWKSIPTMQLGTGCTVHLRKNELPSGRLIVSVSKHLTCVIDGTIYDTHDCSRNNNRCVYGYYIRNEKS